MVLLMVNERVACWAAQMVAYWDMMMDHMMVDC